MSEKDLSLDDTLKELLEEGDSQPAADTTPEKPKRTRRTKAQIEADKKAAEEAKASEEATVDETAESSDAAEDPKPEDDVASENAPKEDPSEDTAEETAEPLTPEIIPDGESDSEETEESGVAPMAFVSEDPIKMTPEVVADTEEDAQPDIEEPKVAPQGKKPVKKDDVINALNGTDGTKVDPNSQIGKSVILANLTPMYRARHTSMPIRPYRGLVTIIEDSKNGFFKVQFLRSGFGLCEGFIEEQYINCLLEGESNEGEQEA